MNEENSIVNLQYDDKKMIMLPKHVYEQLQKIKETSPYILPSNDESVVYVIRFLLNYFEYMENIRKEWCEQLEELD